MKHPASQRASHLVTGSLVGIAFGAGIGALAWRAFMRLEFAKLALGSDDHGLASALLVPATAASLTALALLPVELVFCAMERRFDAWRRLRLPWTYFVLCCAGASLLLGSAWIASNVTRDPSGRRGLALFAGLAAACAMSTIVLAGAARHPIPRARRAPSRLLSIVVASLAVTAVLAAVLSWRALAQEPAPAAVRQHQDGSAPGLRTRSGTARPDIVLISIDTLRADHLGSYGYSRPTSPHLDSLATVAARFANMRSCAPWTLPAHASMLTGLYPTRHGARFVSNFSFLSSASSAEVDPRATSVAELLSGSGYDTGAFTTVRWLSPAFGTVRGFATAELRNSEPARSLVDRALAWIDRGGAARTDSPRPPLFLFLHFFDVHNYLAPAADRALFAEPGYRGPLLGRAGLLMQNRFDSLDPADLRYAVGEYDAALHYVDAELGRLFAALADLGRFDRTLIVVTSDHGEEFWEHAGTGHGFTLYDEMLRVPLIVKPPDTQRAAVTLSQALVSTIDVAPTILDYAGVSAPPGLDGRSLRGVIEGGELTPRAIFAEDTYFFNTYAAVDGESKLIEHRVPPLRLFDPRLLLANIRSFFKFRAPEQFDLRRDPGERSSNPELDGTALRRALAAHLAAARRDTVSEPVDQPTLEELRSLGYIR